MRTFSSVESSHSIERWPMPFGMNSMSPGCMILTPISVSHFSAPLTQKMISWASMLRCQKPISCLRRLLTSTITLSEVKSRSGVPSALSMFDGENFSSKMLNMRKISAISSTPALTTGGSLCASTTFLPLMVTSSRYTGLACCAASFLVCSFIVFSSSTDSDSFLQRRHDAGVSRTTADVSAQHLAQLLLGRFRVAREEIGERHEDAGRAEPALQGVVVLERLLQLVQLAIVA